MGADYTQRKGEDQGRGELCLPHTRHLQQHQADKAQEDGDGDECFQPRIDNGDKKLGKDASWLVDTRRNWHPWDHRTAGDAGRIVVGHRFFAPFLTAFRLAAFFPFGGGGVFSMADTVPRKSLGSFSLEFLLLAALPRFMFPPFFFATIAVGVHELDVVRIPCATVRSPDYMVLGPGGRRQPRMALFATLSAIKDLSNNSGVSRGLGDSGCRGTNTFRLSKVLQLRLRLNQSEDFAFVAAPPLNASDAAHSNVVSGSNDCHNYQDAWNQASRHCTSPLLAALLTPQPSHVASETEKGEDGVD